jgi:hypothetical protein
MRTRTPRYPKAQSLIPVIVALAGGIPADETPRYEWRLSDQGTPHLRFAATTRNLPWLVDIYSGHFYRAQVGNQLSEVCRSLPSLTGYLLRMLGLIDRDGEG